MCDVKDLLFQVQQAFEKANFQLADAFSEACDHSRKEAVDYLRFWNTIELTSEKTKVDALKKQTSKDVESAIKTLDGANNSSDGESSDSDFQTLLQLFGDLDTRPSVSENMGSEFNTLDGAINSSDDESSDAFTAVWRSGYSSNSC